jgi:Bacterial Ig domain
MTLESLSAAEQALINDLGLQLDFHQGDVVMFLMDMADVHTQYEPIVIAQAPQTQANKSTIDGTVGVCRVIQNAGVSVMPGGDDSARTAPYGLAPLATIKNYIYITEKRVVQISGNTAVLQKPTHGTVEMKADGRLSYSPESGYFGKDRVVLLVEMDGRKFKLVYNIHVLEGVVTYQDDEELCPKSIWRISLNPDDPTAPEYTFQLPSQLANNGFGAIGNVDLKIANLSGTSVGQTLYNSPSTGLRASITLDIDAAGHGWFIDATPFDNREFLPTSNPGQWIARPGSAAEGKMDMLSVLLHEYGHVPLSDDR